MAVDDPAAPAVRLIELKSKTAVVTVPLPREMQKWAAVALSPDGKLFVVETVERAEPSISVLEDYCSGVTRMKNFFWNYRFCIKFWNVIKLII